MKFSKLFGASLLLVMGAIAYCQDVPDGVRYKKAPDDVNNLAKSNLENALTSSGLPSNVFGGVFVAGPMLWRALKPGADKVLLGAKPITVIISGKSSYSAEGRVIRTDEERKIFWKRFRTEYPNLKDAKVRKAKAEEILHYWATIPFDIEEPFWVVDAGGDAFIADFEVEAGQPRLLWIDLVGDLAKLKP